MNNTQIFAFKKFLIVALSWLLVIGCRTEECNQINPEVKVANFNVDISNEEANVAVDFKDCQGDFGHFEGSPQPNFFIYYQEFVNGEWQHELLTFDTCQVISGDTICDSENKDRITANIPFEPSPSRNNVQQGTIEQRITFPIFNAVTTPDSFRYEYFIVDQELDTSNSVFSEVVQKSWFD